MKFSSICKSRAILASAAVAALGAAVDRADGAQISANFYVNNGGTISGVVDTGGPAGVSPVAQQNNWNNLAVSFVPTTSYGDSTALTSASLVDNSGTNTPLTLTASDPSIGNSFNNISQSGSSAGTPEDRQLFTVTDDGTVDSNFAMYTAGLSLALANVPYAKYNVYLYVAAASSNQTISVTDGTTKFYFQTPNLTFSGYTQITSTVSSAPTTTGDYVEFANETTSTLTMNMNTPITGSFVSFGAYGLQVVQVVPEPAPLFLSSVGAAALLLRRRPRAKPKTS